MSERVGAAHLSAGASAAAGAGVACPSCGGPAALADGCARRFSQEVERFGGTVLRVIGDEVLAVFGAPAAHEDDAERAVRAALAIRDCALAAPAGTPLRTHSGVNTGEVMAGVAG